MATLEELEARVAALEAEAPPAIPPGVAPLATNPPITVGELTDVPAPGSPIRSAWAQEVSNRIVHRFASLAALNGWAAADGSLAFVTGDGIYLRQGGIWRKVAPPQQYYTFLNADTVVGAGANNTVLSLNVPTLAAGLFAATTFNLIYAQAAGNVGAFDVSFAQTGGGPWLAQLPGSQNGIQGHFFGFGTSAIAMTMTISVNAWAGKPVTIKAGTCIRVEVL